MNLVDSFIEDTNIRRILSNAVSWLLYVNDNTRPSLSDKMMGHLPWLRKAGLKESVEPGNVGESEASNLAGA